MKANPLKPELRIMLLDFGTGCSLLVFSYCTAPILSLLLMVRCTKAVARTHV